MSRPRDLVEIGFAQTDGSGVEKTLHGDSRFFRNVGKCWTRTGGWNSGNVDVVLRKVKMETGRTDDTAISETLTRNGTPSSGLEACLSC